MALQNRLTPLPAAAATAAAAQSQTSCVLHLANLIGHVFGRRSRAICIRDMRTRLICRLVSPVVAVSLARIGLPATSAKIKDKV